MLRLHNNNNNNPNLLPERISVLQSDLDLNLSNIYLRFLRVCSQIVPVWPTAVLQSVTDLLSSQSFTVTAANVSAANSLFYGLNT